MYDSELRFYYIYKLHDMHQTQGSYIGQLRINDQLDCAYFIKQARLGLGLNLLALLRLFSFFYIYLYMHPFHTQGNLYSNLYQITLSCLLYLFSLIQPLTWLPSANEDNRNSTGHMWSEIELNNYLYRFFQNSFYL